LGNIAADIKDGQTIIQLTKEIKPVLKTALIYDFLPWHNSPNWPKVSSLSRIHDHTQRRTTLGRTPLDE